MTTILHTESSMNLGGQELRILMEMEGLAAYGYRSILAARPGSRIIKEAESRGLAVYGVGMRGSLDPVAVLGFLGIIRREKVDIINAHGSKDGWSAGLAARLTGREVVRSRHIANPIRSHYFGRLAYGPLCDVVMTTSESIKYGLIARGVRPEKIISVPTGIDTDAFRPDIRRGAFRRELGIDEGGRLVGFVSVVRGDKGPDVFVRAAEAVLDRVDDVSFVLVGDGWMLPEIKDMAGRSRHSDKIHITGYRRDVPHVMADLDILVLPARVPEGVPQALLQAHATMTPVIATDVGGINEVAVDGVTARLVPPGDPKALDGALAGAIMEMLGDMGAAERLARAGYDMVMRGYTKDVMLKSMDAIYRGLVGG